MPSCGPAGPIGPRDSAAVRSSQPEAVRAGPRASRWVAAIFFVFFSVRRPRVAHGCLRRWQLITCRIGRHLCSFQGPILDSGPPSNFGLFCWPCLSIRPSWAPKTSTGVFQRGIDRIVVPFGGISGYPLVDDLRQGHFEN